MKLQTKALIYQLACFALLFLASRYLIAEFTGLTGYWIPITAFVIGTILSPQFKAVRTKDGEKLFMTWVFMKGYRELK